MKLNIFEVSEGWLQLSPRFLGFNLASCKRHEIYNKSFLSNISLCFKTRQITTPLSNWKCVLLARKWSVMETHFHQLALFCGRPHLVPLKRKRQLGYGMAVLPIKTKPQNVEWRLKYIYQDFTEPSYKIKTGLLILFSHWSKLLKLVHNCMATRE